VWPRCDAEASPERGYYYHPSRHSAGQPIIAGWAYQFVAQLGFERDSWVAPVDAKGVKPTQNTDQVAAEQVCALVARLPQPEALPIFVFDAGYDPVKLQRTLEGCPARILVRLHSNRVFYASPEEVEPRPVGRPRRHGKKFDLKDPASWPEPAGEHRCESGDYGSVRVRCWSGLHPKTRRIGGERYGCKRAPVVRGSVVLVEVGKLPRQTRKPKKLWLWWSGAGEVDRPHLAGVMSQVRPRTLNTLHETNPGLDDAEGASPRAGRPLDLAGIGCLRPAEAGAHHRRRRKTTLGACAAASAVDPDPRPAGFRDTPGGRRHPGEAPETLW
jgi:hypothetical protein